MKAQSETEETRTLFLKSSSSEPFRFQFFRKPIAGSKAAGIVARWEQGAISGHLANILEDGTRPAPLNRIIQSKEIARLRRLYSLPSSSVSLTNAVVLIQQWRVSKRRLPGGTGMRGCAASLP